MGSKTISFRSSPGILLENTCTCTKWSRQARNHVRCFWQIDRWEKRKRFRRATKYNVNAAAIFRINATEGLQRLLAVFKCHLSPTILQKFEHAQQNNRFPAWVRGSSLKKTRLKVARKVRTRLSWLVDGYRAAIHPLPPLPLPSLSSISPFPALHASPQRTRKAIKYPPADAEEFARVYTRGGYTYVPEAKQSRK